MCAEMVRMGEAISHQTFVFVVNECCSFLNFEIRKSIA
jgi:hypothetical protein